MTDLFETLGNFLISVINAVTYPFFYLLNLITVQLVYIANSLSNLWNALNDLWNALNGLLSSFLDLIGEPFKTILLTSLGVVIMLRIYYFIRGS